MDTVEEQHLSKQQLFSDSGCQCDKPHRLFGLMGLSLSAWLYIKGDNSLPPPSSAFQHLAVPASSRLAVILTSSSVPPGDSNSHWSSVHHSPHFLLSSCKRRVIRSPAELSSDGVRAEMGVKSGLHVWEVLWGPNHRGSHAVIGVSTQNCPLQASGYNVLIGGDSRSWGWELKTNQLWHNGQSLGLYPKKRQRGPSEDAETPLHIPERILLVLDSDAGTLGFIIDGTFLGMAFEGLPCGVELFPAVSSVRGGASIQLRYLNGATRDPPALMALCRLSIRQFLGEDRQEQTAKLPLPPCLLSYVVSSH
ncbi:SPRY domain-containing SOCS box protein 1 [Xyrichtys novacula]|uniref:SPRY domain-containing SOCS box protein 1 n=1 Tax=Xyrichtys novacula TaxID=13765 RepID=A0AAV1FMN1_XYRNO|nr:SPRY domain-containing SOCS box protein 1 [Xyrichtys novacula]